MRHLPSSRIRMITTAKTIRRQPRLIFLIGFVLSSISCLACNPQPKDRTFDEQIAADTYRYKSPDGVIQNDPGVIEALDLSLQSEYPVWRDSLKVSVRILLKNTTQSIVHARVMPHLFIYDAQSQKPLYWSNIDFSYAESVGPGTMSVISLPVAATHSTAVPIKAVKFAMVDSSTWPEYNIYEFVPTGEYTMRLELDFYNDKNEKIGTMHSNFIEFTSIVNAPEAIPVPPKTS